MFALVFLLYSLAWTQYTASAAVTLYVSVDGLPSATCAIDSKCPITNALTIMQNGDTLQFSEGVYSVNLEFSSFSGITLKGNFLGNTVFRCLSNVSPLLRYTPSSGGSITLIDLTFVGCINTATRISWLLFDSAAVEMQRCSVSDMVGAEAVSFSGGVVAAKLKVVSSFFLRNRNIFPLDQSVGGGVISISNSGPQFAVQLTSCEFRKNNVTDSSGGAIVLKMSSSTSSRCDVDLKNCLFEQNVAGTRGGAIALLDPNPQFLYFSVVTSIFRENQSFEDGSALFSQAKDNVFDTCLLQGNVVANRVDKLSGQGAVFVQPGGLNMTKTTFRSNVAARGGGVSFGFSTTSVDSSLSSETLFFLSNVADTQNRVDGLGGGMVIGTGTPTISALNGVYFCNNTSSSNFGTDLSCSAAFVTTVNLNLDASSGLNCSLPSSQLYACKYDLGVPIGQISCNDLSTPIASASNVACNPSIVTPADLIASGVGTIVNGTSLSGQIINGDVIVSPTGSLIIVSGQPLIVTGSLTFLPGSSATVIVSSSGNVVVATASQLTGQPTTLNVVSGSSACSVSGSSTQVTSTTLSVLVTMTGPCASPTGNSSTTGTPSGSSNSLSTGAIVGIAIGAVVGGILLALAIVAIVYCLRKNRDAKARIELAKSNISSIH